MSIPQTLSLGPLTIHLYGITFVLAAIVAYFVGRSFAKRRGITVEQFDDMAFWALVIGFICARAYYVIFYPQYYAGSFWEIFKTWDGGLAIYGGLIGGAAAIAWRARRLKIRLFAAFDVFAFGLPLAQAIGRIGNYINHEAFGNPTNLPWKIFIPLTDRPPGYTQYQYFQPTFLYEMIWDLSTFAALYFIFVRRAKKKSPGEAQNRAGTLTATYFLFYAFGRFWIEGLRLDSAYVFGLRVDQITSVLLFALGCGILYWIRHEFQSKP